MGQQAGGWMDGWVDGLVDGWMGGWLGGWMDGWMGGWLGWWMAAECKADPLSGGLSVSSQLIGIQPESQGHTRASYSYMDFLFV